MKRFVLLVSPVLLLAWLATWLITGHVHAQTTSGNGNQTVTIMAAGDISCDPASPFFNGGAGAAKNCHEMATSDLLLSGHPDAILPLGDLQYGGGTLTKFEQSYDPSWGRGKSVSHPIPGNEDYATAEAAGYFSYFGSQAAPQHGGYYSFDLGAWHIIALNSLCDHVGGCDAGSPQDQWLLSDLAAHRDSCTLAFWHYPRFTSGANRNHPEMQTFWNDLYAFGAAIVLNGHDHIYERFAPQNPQEKADPNGIREFIVGTGGNNHQPKLGTIQPTSALRDNTTYGVLKLTLRPGQYDWQFIPDTQTGNGTFTDKGTGTCPGLNAGTQNGTGPRAVPVVASSDGGTTARFTVDFTSDKPGQASVMFGPSCSDLVMTGTQDAGAGTTHHVLVVTGDDLAGPDGSGAITPDNTYYYETSTMTSGGTVIDNNGGKCYSVTIPAK